MKHYKVKTKYQRLETLYKFKYNLSVGKDYKKDLIRRFIEKRTT